MLAVLDRITKLIIHIWYDMLFTLGTVNAVYIIYEYYVSDI